MGEIKSFKSMKLTIVRATDRPGHLVRMASDLTQKKEPTGMEASSNLIKYLLQANHTSIFEHASMTVHIENVSRAFLAQITRHRMASYTAGSQHYQDYTGYADLIPEHLASNEDVCNAISVVDFYYKKLIDNGIKPEDARYILPNSKIVNILWTINARSLINFLNLRMCRRNVYEMYLFATRLHKICMLWWPDLFIHVGPDCLHGPCYQGKMQAQECQGVVRQYGKTKAERRSILKDGGGSE